MSYEDELEHVTFNLDKISKSEKKNLKRYCEFMYLENFRSHMKWLPESIYDVTDENIKGIATVDSMTGTQFLEPFLKLRKSALEIKKRLP